ncbi:MAG: hypothetical protein AAFX58_12850 [Pseudomonadota bacterium]
MQRRNIFVITAAAVFLVGACMDPTPPPSATTAAASGSEGAVGAPDVGTIVTGCNSCHAGTLSLADWSAGDLATRIRELSNGGGAHPAAIPPLSDAELAAVAEALTSS